MELRDQGSWRGTCRCSPEGSETLMSFLYAPTVTQQQHQLGEEAPREHSFATPAVSTFAFTVNIAPRTSLDLMAASKRGESPSCRTHGDPHFATALLLAPFPVNTPFGVASTFLFNAKIKIKTRKQTKQNRTFTSNPTPFFTNRSQNLAHSQSCQQKIRFYFQNLQKKKKGKSGREEPGDQIGGPASSERGEEFRMVFEGWEETDPRES